MGFEITKTFVVKAPPAAVWDFLIDPERVAKCLPGAAITEKLDDKTYRGTMTVKVGPVSSSYKGKVVFERLDEASHTAEISASGQDVKGRGGADMRLKSSVARNASGETEVTAVSQVNITGILAQMGRGMVQDVSDQLFQIFSQRVRAELETTGHVAAPAPAPAPPPEDKPEALDIGRIGAKAAGNAAARAARGPLLWVALGAAAVVIYLLLK
jgi:carbon monoxide dehydrogenase subunit G